MINRLPSWSHISNGFYMVIESYLKYSCLLWFNSQQVGSRIKQCVHELIGK